MDPSVFHDFTAGGDGWHWRKGSGVVMSGDGDTRLVLPGCARTPETVEAFVHGWVDGRRAGIQWGNVEGAENVRADLRRLLGVPAIHVVDPD